MTVFELPPDLERLAERLVAASAESGDRLVTAESCTAGLIGVCLASVPRSSEVFAGSFVTYRAAMKTDALGVPAELIAEKTPYHPEVARRMALGALERAKHATVALAVTGVGGPGPDCGKPQGLVYLAAVRRGEDPRVEEHRFSGTPREVLAQTVRAAWDREDTQQRVREMQDGLEKMVQEVRGAIDDSMNTPQGQRIKQDANRAAESLRNAGEQTVQEVRPQLINALQQLNSELQQWIDKMENRTPPPPSEPMNDDDGVAGTA